MTRKELDIYIDEFVRNYYTYNERTDEENRAIWEEEAKVDLSMPETYELWIALDCYIGDCKNCGGHPGKIYRCPSAEEKAAAERYEEWENRVADTSYYDEIMARR